MRRLFAILLALLAGWAVMDPGAAQAQAQTNTLCISRLNDLTATVLPGAGTLELADSAILIEKRRNQPGVGNSNYTITASGQGGGFNLAHGGGGAPLPFSVFWAAAAGITASGSATALTHNTATSFSGALTLAQGSTLNSCGDSGGASNASIILRFDAAALNAAASGIYSGTLILLIGP